MYASGRNGWASRKKDVKTETLMDIFDTVIEHVPPPKVTREGAAQMLVNNLSYNNYLGRLVIGRVERGTFRTNQLISVLGEDGKSQNAKIVKMRVYRGLEQVDVDEVAAGDIGIFATGLTDLAIGDEGRTGAR